MRSAGGADVRISLGEGRDVPTSYAGTREARQVLEQRYGSLTNTQFVTLVYQNVLGRTPAQVEIDYWVGHLDAGRTTRGLVMLGFLESDEYKAKSYDQVYVTMMYIGMLRRSPQQPDLDYWVFTIKSGVSRLQLIHDFLNSAEYHNRFLPAVQ